MTVHIKFTKFTKRKVAEQDCPTCKSKQEFLCEFENWYGWTTTCLNCGDRWQDGELCPRPFFRGWRKQSVRHALEKVKKYGLKRAVKSKGIYILDTHNPPKTR